MTILTRVEGVFFWEGGEGTQNGNVFCPKVEGFVLNYTLQNNTVILKILYQLGRGFLVSNRKSEVPFLLPDDRLFYFILFIIYFDSAYILYVQSNTK